MQNKPSTDGKKRKGKQQRQFKLCSLPVSYLTSRFWCGGQQPEDAHGLVALVDALVFHLLDVRQRVHRATEVGFPRLWVTGLTFHVLPCKKNNKKTTSLLTSLSIQTKRRISCLCSQWACILELSHLCGWPTTWTDSRPCPAPSRVGPHASRELRTSSCPVKIQRGRLSWRGGCTFHLKTNQNYEHYFFHIAEGCHSNWASKYSFMLNYVNVLFA